MSAGRALGLRVGERVTVRSLEEILDTLDDDGCLDALPFMPEMAKRCGQDFTVLKRVDKINDLVDRIEAPTTATAAPYAPNRSTSTISKVTSSRTKITFAFTTAGGWPVAISTAHMEE